MIDTIAPARTRSRASSASNRSPLRNSARARVLSGVSEYEAFKAPIDGALARAQ